MSVYLIQAEFIHLKVNAAERMMNEGKNFLDFLFISRSDSETQHSTNLKEEYINWFE